MGLGFGVLLIGVATVLISCYPGGPTDPVEFDTVVTVFNEDADFSKNKTYAMPDFIPFLCDSNDTSCDSTLLDRSNDAFILQTVADNMQAYGYTRITNIDTINGPVPDVVVVVSVTASENWVAYRWYGWYGGWGGWGGWGWWGYPPGWGWGYPPGGISVTNYKTGTLFIDMVDPVNPNSENPDGPSIPILWDAAINGLLERSTVNNQDRLKKWIDQAYTQSPYLNVN
jgi:hypothetical protein